MAARVIGSGVVKSGSPMVRLMTSFISASMSKKRRMPDGGMARTRSFRKSAVGRGRHRGGASSSFGRQCTQPASATPAGGRTRQPLPSRPDQRVTTCGQGRWPAIGRVARGVRHRRAGQAGRRARDRVVDAHGLDHDDVEPAGDLAVEPLHARQVLVLCPGTDPDGGLRAAGHQLAHEEPERLVAARSELDDHADLSAIRIGGDHRAGRRGTCRRRRERDADQRAELAEVRAQPGGEVGGSPQLAPDPRDGDDRSGSRRRPRRRRRWTGRARGSCPAARPATEDPRGWATVGSVETDIGEWHLA